MSGISCTATEFNIVSINDDTDDVDLLEIDL